VRGVKVLIQKDRGKKEVCGKEGRKKRSREGHGIYIVIHRVILPLMVQDHDG
jgi:hypothetical protein